MVDDPHNWPEPIRAAAADPGRHQMQFTVDRYPRTAALNIMAGRTFSREALDEVTMQMAQFVIARVANKAHMRQAEGGPMPQYLRVVVTVDVEEVD